MCRNEIGSYCNRNFLSLAFKLVYFFILNPEVDGNTTVEKRVIKAIWQMDQQNPE